MSEQITCEVFRNGVSIGVGDVTEIRNYGDFNEWSGRKTYSQCSITATLRNPNFNKQNTKEMDETFFMNYMEGGSAPTFKFTNQTDALAEAARLASNHKTAVYTLRAVIKTKPKHDVTTEELKEKALPPAGE